MPNSVDLKTTSEEDGTYSVKDSKGNKLFSVAVDENGHAAVYNKKGEVFSELYIE